MPQIGIMMEQYGRHFPVGMEVIIDRARDNDYSVTNSTGHREWIPQYYVQIIVRDKEHLEFERKMFEFKKGIISSFVHLLQYDKNYTEEELELILSYGSKDYNYCKKKLL